MASSSPSARPLRPTASIAASRRESSSFGQSRRTRSYPLGSRSRMVLVAFPNHPTAVGASSPFSSTTDASRAASSRSLGSPISPRIISAVDAVLGSGRPRGSVRSGRGSGREGARNAQQHHGAVAGVEGERFRSRVVRRRGEAAVPEGDEQVSDRPVAERPPAPSPRPCWERSESRFASVTIFRILAGGVASAASVAPARFGRRARAQAERAEEDHRLSDVSSQRNTFQYRRDGGF